MMREAMEPWGTDPNSLDWFTRLPSIFLWRRVARVMRPKATRRQQVAAARELRLWSWALQVIGAAVFITIFIVVLLTK